MSVTIIGLNVSCGSESSPGIDTSYMDWLRISVRWPDMKEIAYIDVPLYGKNTRGAGVRGDVNREIGQRTDAAFRRAVSSGQVPLAHAGEFKVEEKPDPKHPNTRPIRIQIYNALEVNVGTSCGKLATFIFNPNPKGGKRPRVKAVTPTRKGSPPPPRTPGNVTPTTPGAGARIKAKLKNRGKEGKHKLGGLKDRPWDPLFPKVHDWRRRFGGGGWWPFGQWTIVPQGAAQSAGPDQAWPATTIVVPFPYVLSSPEAQIEAMAVALAAAGIEVEFDAEGIVIGSLVDGRGPPDSIGVSSAYDPMGVGPAFPYETVFTYPGQPLVALPASEGIAGVVSPARVGDEVSAPVERAAIDIARRAASPDPHAQPIQRYDQGPW